MNTRDAFSPTVAAPLRVAVVDDQEFARIGLAYALAKVEHIRIVGQAQNSRETRALLAQTPADILVMVWPLENQDGVAWLQQLKQDYPALGVVVISRLQDTASACGALGAGARAFCSREISTQGLLTVFDVVNRGGLWLDPLAYPEVCTVLAAGSTEAPPSLGNASPRSDISHRELEVLNLIAQGKSNKEIGLLMHISSNTVKNHLRNISIKLNVDDRTQASRKALVLGLISDPNAR